jgi:hypothetical protein
MAKLDPIAEFREDHRTVRDGLLEIIDALKAKDVATARAVLERLNPLLGSHFSYAGSKSVSWGRCHFPDRTRHPRR